MTRASLAAMVGALTLSPPSSAFAPLQVQVMPVPRVSTRSTAPSPLLMTNTNNNQDEETTINNNNNNIDYNPLGIEIGKQMDFLHTEEERAELKAQLKTIIDSAVEDGITDLGKLHEKWQRDLNDGQAFAKLELKMNQNGQIQSKKFNRKVDDLVDSFFNSTFASRAETHKLAHEDRQRQQQEKKEKERAERKAKEGPKMASWERTNDAWDKEWDDW